MIAPATTAVVLALGMTFTFAGCANESVKEQVEDPEILIDFSTAVDKATRAENSSASYEWNLEDHHDDFKVWGYKNTNTTTPVFNGEKVASTGSGDSQKWTYTNNRYWDKAATAYYFYACAPYGAPLTFNGSQDSGYFTTTSAHTVEGTNVSPSTKTTTPQSSWKSFTSGDKDLMIAEKCELTSTALTNAYTGYVTLKFIHILSRLNITVKTTDDFLPVTGKTDKVKVTSITIGHMNNSGTFAENTTGVTAEALAAGTTARWTADGDNDYTYTLNYEADQTSKYVIETLVMPQKAGVETIALDGSTTETKPFIKVAYQIISGAESESPKTEDFVAYYNLAKAFGKTGDATLDFNEGWVNTLNLTISPALIKFDATVASWAEATDAGAELKVN